MRESELTTPKGLCPPLYFSSRNEVDNEELMLERSYEAAREYHKLLQKGQDHEDKR